MCRGVFHRSLYPVFSMPHSFSFKSLAQQVAERIENEIMEGHFVPGQRLRESTLSNEWDISRSPIREAMRILTGEGLLEFRPRKGTFVAPLSKEELENLYTIRASLESLAISLTIRRNRDSVLPKLKAVQEELKKAVEAGNMQTYRKLNTAFHDTYIQACGNPQLINMLHSLEKHIQRYRMKTTIKRGFADLIANHENIIRLIADGDEEAAAAARKKRILSNITLILQDFD